MRKKNARSIATQVLTQVIGYKHSLSDCLDTALPSLNDARDRALAQALCYGVLRWLPRLQALLQRLLRKPFKAKDSDIEVVAKGILELEKEVVERGSASDGVCGRASLPPWRVRTMSTVLR